MKMSGTVAESTVTTAAVHLLVILLTVSSAVQLTDGKVLGDSVSLQQNSISSISKFLVAAGDRIKRQSSTGNEIGIIPSSARDSPATSPQSQSPMSSPSLSSTPAARFKKLMKLLKAGKLQDCAGRVVCDLSCDASRYGSSGDKVYAMMTRVQNSGLMDVEDLQLLGSAGVSGRMYYWTTGCGRCRDVYPSCFAQSEDLIQVAAIFDIDSF